MSSTAAANSNLADLDRRYNFHPFTALSTHEANGPSIVMAGGKGVWLEDINGKRYLDGMAGLWCVNVGYGRKELAEAMRDQAETLSYCHAFSSMSSDKPALLAERLIESAPVPMSKVFFGNSGSDANDTQVKLVWYYNNVRGKPEKKKIISRRRGYHGVTVVSGSLTGLPFAHGGFDLPLPFVHHVSPPHKLWEGHDLDDETFVGKLVDELEQLIEAEGADTIGAMIAEPVMGAGGVVVPPDGYFEAIQAVLKKHDILLIADEVICGFGRLGHRFGSEALNIKPDLITIAKGVTSAYFPLSGVMVSEEVWRTIVDGEKKFGAFGHGYTYSAHPIGAAVALANLDLIEQEGLIANAAARGRHLHSRLQDAFADFPMTGEIRGLGLVGAVEFLAKKDAPQAFDPNLKVGIRIAQKALENGVISRALPGFDALSFSPPLVISDDEIDTLINGVRAAADAVLSELRSSGDFQG
jgi:L-2,4-diaminobutyrate transaminase